MWWPWHKHKKQIAALEKLRVALAASSNKLAAAIGAAAQTGQRPKMRMMMGAPNTLDTEIAALQAQVQQTTTVEASAVTLINGIAAQIAAAVAAATAAGATPAELQAVTDVQTALAASAATLSAAVAANTGTPAAAGSAQPAGGTVAGGSAKRS